MREIFSKPLRITRGFTNQTQTSSKSRKKEDLGENSNTLPSKPSHHPENPTLERRLNKPKDENPGWYHDSWGG